MGLVMQASARVLVVDDEAGQLETLCRGLLFLGFACLPARTEAEALAELTGSAGERVDLLLADLSAPGKPGARVVDRVLRSRPGLPVLVVSGLARSTEVRALHARGVPILQKPFTPEQLGRAIRMVLTDTKGRAT
jgi:DNA-binding response OmpR family regulator